MSKRLSLSELARQIEENQAALVRALQTAGMAPVTNFLAKLTDSCLNLLAEKGDWLRQIAELEKRVSSRDTAVEQLILKLEALEKEAHASGNADTSSLNDQLSGIEEDQQVLLNIAERQTNLLGMIEEQRKLVQERLDILRDVVAEDNALIAGLTKLKEEDDAASKQEE